MDPLNVTRESFPKCTRTVAGMHVINPTCDSYELNYHDDIEYVYRDGKKLYLQIIDPIGRTEKMPLVVFIPGSAFHTQNVKERVTDLALLARFGYVVALLEYRGSETAEFPALVLDAKAGIAYMKKNAEKYNIDVDKVYVMGDSSGGYTALMAGLTNGVTSLEDEISSNEDYTVKGVIDYYGPTDFTTMNDEPSSQDHRTPDSPEGLIIGGVSPTDRRDKSEPAIIKNYVCDGRELPPVIMFHGSNDELVPFSQSCELYEALKQNGHDVELYQLEGAHHGDRRLWSDTVLNMLCDFIR